MRDEAPNWMAALARVARGEAFSAAAGTGCLPTAAQWRARQARDTDFAAVVLALASLADPKALAEEAELHRAEALAERWPDEAYDAVIARVAGGESFYWLSKAPGGPTPNAWIAKRRTDPDCDARLVAAMGRRGGKHGIRPEEWEAALKALHRGVTTDRLSTLGLLSGKTLSVRAARDPAFAERYRAAIADHRCGSRFGEELFDQALQALRRGALTHELTAQGCISACALRNRAKREPAFARRYAEALASRPRRSASEETNHRQSLSRDAIYATADRAVPRWLPVDAREEIIAELVLATLEGDLLAEDIPAAAAEFTAEHGAQYASPRMRSMDAALPGQEGRTLHDVVGSF